MASWAQTPLPQNHYIQINHHSLPFIPPLNDFWVVHKMPPAFFSRINPLLRCDNAATFPTLASRQSGKDLHCQSGETNEGSDAWYTRPLWKYFSSLWKNQPIWKICSSNWIISPGFGVKLKNIWNHHPVLWLWKKMSLRCTWTAEGCGKECFLNLEKSAMFWFRWK